MTEKPSGRPLRSSGRGPAALPSLNDAGCCTPLCEPLIENSTGPPVTVKPMLTRDWPLKRSTSKSPSGVGSPVPVPSALPLLVTSRPSPASDTSVRWSATRRRADAAVLVEVLGRGARGHLGLEVLGARLALVVVAVALLLRAVDRGVGLDAGEPARDLRPCPRPRLAGAGEERAPTSATSTHRALTARRYAAHARASSARSR